MKKFLVVLVVVAMTCLSAVAFAADVTLGGSYEIRSRDFDSLGFNKNSNTTDVRDTQNRIRIDINAKAGDNVKGKLELESDFGTGASDWGTGSDALTLVGGGGYATSTANGAFGFREAWVSFNLPGLPLNVTGGHQLLQLGNGWFFRSMHYGADAWVVANQTGNNTAAFVDVKALEGAVGVPDDIDAYVFLDVLKLNDNNTVGIDITAANDRRSSLPFAGTSTKAYNVGLNYNGKMGIVALKAELDLQAGTATDANLVAAPASGDAKFKGNQIVIQGNVALDPVTVNFTVARGTGDKIGQTDYNGYKNFLDIDPHYTFLYEYKLATAAGAAHTGFQNTTALSVGASVAATANVTVGADIWMLSATEKIQPAFAGSAPSDKVGTELDLKLNWKLYDNLAWNWTAGIFKPGDALKTAAGTTDKATGIQGVLAFKF